MNRIALILLTLYAVSSHATEEANPFSRLPAPPAAAPLLSAPPAPPPPPPAEESLPASFVENRSVFDLLEVVGRSDTSAVLRYPMAGSTGGVGGGASAAQGQAFRTVIVHDGQAVFIGGRSYSVVLPRGATNVLLVDGKRGKTLWEGDLSAPRVYQAAPNVTDFQYSPPAAAVGSGIGFRSTGSATPMPGSQPAPGVAR